MSLITGETKSQPPINIDALEEFVEKEQEQIKRERFSADDEATKIMNSDKKRRHMARLLVAADADAFARADLYHNGIRREQQLYFAASGDSIYDGSLGHLRMHTRQVMNNKIFEVCNTARTHLGQGSPRTFIETASESDSEALSAVQAWIADYEDRDNWQEKLHTAILHMVVGGLAITKTMWDIRQDRLTCRTVSPLSFAVGPSDGGEIDFSDIGFTTERSMRTAGFIRHRYPKWRPTKRSAGDMPVYPVREMWIKPWFAHEELSLKTEVMLYAVLVQNRLMRLRAIPLWFNDFPYAAARGFKRYDASGAPNTFWGFGYPRILGSQQKVLDETITQILLILQNMGLGQFIGIKGAIQRNTISRRPGLYINVDPAILEGRRLQDVIMQVPPQDVPAALFSFLQYIESAMEGNTGITEVLGGQAPFSGASGRSINLLQSAAFATLNDMQRSLVGLIERLSMRKLALVQQLAQRPRDAQKWRTATVQGEFMEAWRYIPFSVRVQDGSQLPHSLAGKLEIAKELLQAGLITPETFYDVTEIDRLYGFDRGENVQAAVSQINQLQQPTAA